MNPEGIVISEISQTEKSKYSMISLLYGLYTIKLTNQTKQKQTHRYRKQMGGCQRKRGLGLREIGEGN